MINLVHNASKHVDYQGTILITIKENEHYFVISVIDNGDGIDDRDLMSVFSGNNGNSHNELYESGSGIGLSIVQHIVEKHSGKFYVGTVPGLGATLSFTLPK